MTGIGDGDSLQIIDRALLLLLRLYRNAVGRGVVGFTINLKSSAIIHLRKNYGVAV